MDMETFVAECKACDVSDAEKVSELLSFAAELGEAVLKARNKKRQDIPYAKIMEMYNSICVSTPKAHKLSPERKRHIASCFKQGFKLEDFEAAFKIAEGTPFLRGENSRGWHVTFDWLINPKNLLKVTENNYGAVQCSSRSEDIFTEGLNAIFENAKNSTPKIHGKD